MPWLLPSRHLATGLACDRVNLHLPPEGKAVITFFPSAFVSIRGELKPSPPGKSTQQVVLVGSPSWRAPGDGKSLSGPASWQYHEAISLPRALQAPQRCYRAQRPAKASCNQKSNHHHPKTAPTTTLPNPSSKTRCEGGTRSNAICPEGTQSRTQHPKPQQKLPDLSPRSLG